MTLLTEQYDPEVRLGHLRRYTFKELRVATDHFNSKNILGKGGFGVVYKGRLNNGTVVAVKRLKDYNAVGGEIQFQTEVELISLAVHRNLLRLWGCCSTENERLLIYPYMSNGSVASRLKGLKILLSSIVLKLIITLSYVQMERTHQAPGFYVKSNIVDILVFQKERCSLRIQVYRKSVSSITAHNN